MSWYTVNCEECGKEIPVHEDWSNPPRFCKECKERKAAEWYEKSCESCGTTISVHRDWDNPPKYCKKCNSIYTPKNISCRKCGKSFTISTTLQIKCKERGWDLPSQCRECKQDDLLIKGAIGHCGTNIHLPLRQQLNNVESFLLIRLLSSEIRRLVKLWRK